jgi:hypothetical protein
MAGVCPKRAKVVGHVLRIQPERPRQLDERLGGGALVARYARNPDQRGRGRGKRSDVELRECPVLQLHREIIVQPLNLSLAGAFQPAMGPRAGRMNQGTNNFAHARKRSHRSFSACVSKKAHELNEQRQQSHSGS